MLWDTKTGYHCVSNLTKGGGLHLKPQKFEHIFELSCLFSPFFCANTFDISLLLIVCALR